MAEKEYKSDLRVINIGTTLFYDALVAQGVKATQIDWKPPVKQSAEVLNALNAISSPELKAKIDAANEVAVHRIIDSQPYLVDILPAGDVIEGLDDYTIIHSGPPIAYEDMVMLHQRGLVSACRFEHWAETDEDAVKLIKSGKVKIMSALDTNTVGAGTGIITKSVAMFIIEDRATGKISANFPAEGPNQGGFCGWGLYSEEIANYLRRMRDEFFPVMRAVLKKMGGLEKMKEINEKKAKILYDYLDESKLFKGTVRKEDRSLMNVPFVTGNEELDAKFVKEAKAAGFENLKGHRTVGGMRASIYNAMPIEGVQKLVEFMKKFEEENA